MMKKRALKMATALLVACNISPLAHGQDLNQQLLKQENAIWATAIGTHPDTEAFRHFLAPGYVQIDGMGAVTDAEQSLAAFKACSLSRFRIEDPSVIALSPTSATLVYRIHVDGTCGGQPIPPSIRTVDTWVRLKGDWRIKIHTETLIMGAQ